MQWAKLRSWHIVSGVSRTTGKAITLCGKQADAPTSETFPFGERSCESCLRIEARRESKP